MDSISLNMKISIILLIMSKENYVIVNGKKYYVQKIRHPIYNIENR